MLHTIRSVAKHTGLSPHVIRVWERRYGAVRPERSATNRRGYSDHEVERLTLLRRATLAGHNISSIATLSVEDLTRLLGVATAPPPASPLPLAPDPVTTTLELCMERIRALDATGLENAISRAALLLGHHGVLHRVIAPLTQLIGERWRDGTITAAHEHFASAVIRGFLFQSSRGFAVPDSAPILVVTTPAGQLHELGAVMVAAAASHLGWKVIYLGTSLPAAEIAGAVAQNQARALALSLVYPEDDPRLPAELALIRKHVQVPILAGGRAARSYRDALFNIGAVVVSDLEQVYGQLESFRTRNRGN